MFDVELYKKMSQFQKLASKNGVNAYSEFIRWSKNGKILDVGCGEGSTTVDLLYPLIMANSSNSKLIAMDLEEDMISAANASYGHMNIDFIQMDITNINENNNKYKNYFDNVFSFICLHLVSDLIWIKNIYDLMKRDGQTFFIIPANNPVFTAVMELRHEGNYIEYVKKVEHVFNTPFAQLNNPEDWIKPLMEKEGFKNVKCFKFPQDFTFESFDYLKRFIATFQFLIKEIPTDEQDDFIEQVANRIIRISTFDETTQEIHASCFILAIIADK
nr:uncharacterized protein LOC111424192 [Onthophagus taurus]